MRSITKLYPIEMDVEEKDVQRPEETAIVGPRIDRIPSNAATGAVQM